MSEPALITRRKAAHALNVLVKELGLGTLGRVFIADRDEDWAVVSEEQVRALGEGRVIAEVWLDGTIADVRVPDAYDLARPEHQMEFQPWEYGIVLRPERDFLKRKIHNDLEAHISVDDVPGLALPQQPMPKTTFSANVSVIKSSR